MQRIWCSRRLKPEINTRKSRLWRSNNAWMWSHKCLARNRIRWAWRSQMTCCWRMKQQKSGTRRTRWITLSMNRTTLVSQTDLSQPKTRSRCMRRGNISSDIRKINRLRTMNQCQINSIKLLVISLTKTKLRKTLMKCLWRDSYPTVRVDIWLFN